VGKRPEARRWCWYLRQGRTERSGGRGSAHAADRWAHGRRPPASQSPARANGVLPAERRPDSIVGAESPHQPRVDPSPGPPQRGVARRPPWLRAQKTLHFPGKRATSCALRFAFSRRSRQETQSAQKQNKLVHSSCADGAGGSWRADCSWRACQSTRDAKACRGPCTEQTASGFSPPPTRRLQGQTRLQGVGWHGAQSRWTRVSCCLL